MWDKLRKNLVTALRFINEAYIEFARDKMYKHGAAISFFTLFSLPAILLIAIRLSSIFFDEQSVKEQVYIQIEQSLGTESAEQISFMISNIRRETNSRWATILGLGTLLFGATGVFYTLRDSLNALWKLPPIVRRSTWPKLIFDRVLSFSMVVILGFIFLILMVLNTVIVAIRTLLNKWDEEITEAAYGISANLGEIADQLEFIVYIAYALDALVSFIIIAITFAIIFKFMSDANPGWREVWLGSLITSLLFSLGRLGIGWYVGSINIVTTYGAAGSVVFILLWVYYSAQIFLLGGEFIWVFCKWRNKEIRPTVLAIKLTDQPFTRMQKRIRKAVAIWKDQSVESPKPPGPDEIVD